MSVMGARSGAVDTKESSGRVWVFRLLVVIAAGVMVAAWFMPWWTVDIESFGDNMVQIRPWGLEVNERMGDFVVLLKGAAMPVWFAPFMWAYLGLCMLALLVGMFVRNVEISLGGFRMQLSQLLIGGVGFSYFVVAVVTAVYASMRAGAMMGVPLVGRSFVDLGDPLVTYVNTSLLPGYYLIYVAGISLMVLALLRDKITG